MNAFDLTRADTGEVVAAACGKCGTVHSPRIYFAPPERAMAAARQSAEDCCAPRKCRECGGETPKYRLVCDACSNAEDEKRERERFAAAEKVSLADYTGETLYDKERDRWLFADDDFGGDDPPACGYAYACNYVPLRLDAGDILDAARESGKHHDEMYFATAAEKELQDFLDGWCERQGEGSFFPDYKRAVVFPPVPAEVEE